MHRRLHRAALITAAFAVAGCIAGPVPSSPAVQGTTSSSRPSPTGTPTVVEVSSFPSEPEPTLSTDSPWVLRLTGDPADAEQFRDVAVAPRTGEIVVVGSTGFAGETPLALHSSDGVAWTAEPIDGSFGSPERVVPWRDGLLAVGDSETNRCAHPFGMSTWTRAADGSWAGPGQGQALCAGGGPSVAVLGGRPWLIGSGTADIPYALDSDDGLTWTDHREALGDVFVGPAGVDAGGLWVAVRDGTTEQASLMRSETGRTWTTDALPVGADVALAATLDDRVVVLAIVHDALRRLTLVDGSWRTEATQGLPREDLAAIRVVDGRIVIIGSHDDGTRDLWVSDDGIDWRSLAVPSEAGAGSTLWSLTSSGDLVVTVGQIEAPDGSIVVGAIWTAPASILAP